MCNKAHKVLLSTHICICVDKLLHIVKVCVLYTIDLKMIWANLCENGTVNVLKFQTPFSLFSHKILL